MGLNESIRDMLSGEVFVQTDDIRECAVSTAKLKDNAVTAAKLSECALVTAGIGDCAVTTAKLGNSAVTTAKIADDGVTRVKIGRDAGVWRGYHWTSTAGASTEPCRVTVSANVTILGVVANITTEASAAGTFVIEDTAGNDILACPTQSLAKSFSSQNQTAFASFAPKVITAGDSVVITIGAASNEIVGDLYLLTITQPA